MRIIRVLLESLKSDDHVIQVSDIEIDDGVSDEVLFDSDQLQTLVDPAVKEFMQKVCASKVTVYVPTLEVYRVSTDEVDA